MLLSISCCNIALVLSLVIHFYSQSNPTSLHELLVKHLLNAFGILIEASQEFPKYITTLSTRISRSYKLTFGVWGLMVVVITNAYKGVVVSDLTSPLPLHTTWNKLSDMAGFHFYTSYKISQSLFSWILNGEKAAGNILMFGNQIQECLEARKNMSSKWCDKDISLLNVENSSCWECN